MADGANIGYTRATSVAEATTARGEFRAGGTDLQERLRSQCGGPGGHALVDLRDVPGLDAIEVGPSGATIGALVRLAEVGAHPGLRAAYPALTLPARELATPQIRSMATMGGVLCQRTRCAYYRHPDLACPKKGNADSCPSRDGFHQRGVCFDFGPCVYPHPSSLGCALLTYDAAVEVAGRGRISVAELYGDGSDPTRDHTLEPGELITRVVLPAPEAGE
ncbi:MAG: FAD binding domain-containing protein, partial [Gemmatimonadota bacterium]|nr:FAD binding domain-containing protein [Gemmatimonadota bacterium]